MTSRTKINVTLAITRTNRWPYYRTRVLGPRASAQPGELQVPLALDIDDQLLRHRSNTVNITLDAGATPGEIKGAVKP